MASTATVVATHPNPLMIRRINQLDTLSIMTEAPKVFISHASEDKDSFVIEFATRLREAAVDAWIDRWELAAGDSLVTGIFHRGIESSSTFVVVLSEVSVRKPWVQKELAVALERSVTEGYKIIPVLLGGLARDTVPTGLRDVVWVSHTNMATTVASVTRAIFGQTEKPVLGLRPAYAQADAAANLLSDPTDDFVLRALLRGMERFDGAGGLTYITSELAGSLMQSDGLLHEQFDESMHFLNAQRWLEAEQFAGQTPGRWLVKSVPASTWLAYRRMQGIDTEALARRLLTALVNSDEPHRVQLRGFEGFDNWTIDAVLSWLRDRSLVQYHETNGGPILAKIEIGARRWLR